MQAKKSILSLFIIVSLFLVSCAAPAAATQAPAQADMATTVSQNSSAAFEVAMKNFSFNPGDLTIKVGTTVTWTNEDNVVHTVTSDTGLFDSGELTKGATFTYTFTEAGVYPYHCIPHHANMKGTITVE
jgi:plastocyanin